MGCAVLVERVGNGQRERRDARLERFAAWRHHRVAAVHGADIGLQRAEAGVFEVLAGLQHRLLADDPGALHFLGLAVRVGDDPVPADELSGVGAHVGDRDVIREDVLFLFGRAAIGQELAGHLHADAVGRCVAHSFIISDVQVPALRVAHLDPVVREVFAPARGHGRRDVVAAGELGRIPRLHPRIDQDRPLVAHVVAHHPGRGGVDVGRRLEPGERRPQEVHVAPHRPGRIVGQDHERPAGEGRVRRQPRRGVLVVREGRPLHDQAAAAVDPHVRHVRGRRRRRAELPRQIADRIAQPQPHALRTFVDGRPGVIERVHRQVRQHVEVRCADRCGPGRAPAWHGSPSGSLADRSGTGTSSATAGPRPGCGTRWPSPRAGSAASPPPPPASGSRSRRRTRAAPPRA